MAAYRTLTSHDIQQIEDDYGFSVIEYFYVSTGVENTTIRINSINFRGEYRVYYFTILEILALRKAKMMASITRQLNHMLCKVPQPQKSLNGKFITTFSGAPAILYPHVNGTSLAYLDHDQLVLLGEEVARIHSFAKNIRTGQFNHRDNPWAARILHKNKAAISKHNEVLYDKIKIVLEKSYCDDNCRHIIHGDLFYDNIIFSHGEVSGIIDFSNYRVDCFMVDICTIIINYCIDDNFNINFEKIDKILEGYRRIKIIPKCHLNNIENFIIVTLVKVFLYRVQLHNQGLRLRSGNTVRINNDQVNHTLRILVRAMKL